MAGAWYLPLITTENGTPIIVMPWLKFHIKSLGNRGHYCFLACTNGLLSLNFFHNMQLVKPLSRLFPWVLDL
jgi:hypothetical protein